MRNQEILERIYDVWGDQLPPRAELEDPENPEYGTLRFLMVATVDYGNDETATGPGGLFSSPAAACSSYDWSNGTPEYLVDLNAGEISESLTPLHLRAIPIGPRRDLSNYI